MNKKWADEQISNYNEIQCIYCLKQKLIQDLKEAIQWLENNDFDSAYRLTSGISEILYLKDSELTNTYFNNEKSDGDSFDNAIKRVEI